MISNLTHLRLGRSVKIAFSNVFPSLDRYSMPWRLSIAKIFAENLKSENFDLIFSGLQSDDMGSGQTGVLIGEMLGMSTATLAIETQVEGDSIKVKRELESGWFQWVTLPFPSSISIQSGINEPRYPSLKGIMGAKRKELNTLKFICSKN